MTIDHVTHFDDEPVTVTSFSIRDFSGDFTVVEFIASENGPGSHVHQYRWFFKSLDLAQHFVNSLREHLDTLEVSICK
jgi:hypothetical protein